MYFIKQLYKYYCLLFYKLVKGVLRLDEVCNKDVITFSMEWVMWRAFIALSYIQLIWLFLSLSIVEIIIGKRIPNPIDDPWIYSIVIFVIISIFNYFTLIYKKRWFKYDEEFATYSKTKNKAINISIFLFYIFSVGLFIGLSLVWANLGHAGKIEGF